MRAVGRSLSRVRTAPHRAAPRPTPHRRCLTTVTTTPRKRVVLGMSGGVDSSVAALILSRNPAYELIGVYMKNWDSQEETVATKCTEEEDNRYLDSVGKQLGMQIHRVDFVKQYWHNVFEPSLRDFAMGYTPNPDILCNREIKFKAFTDWAKEKFGADLVATGHYARIGEPLTPSGPYRLLKSLDDNKDQTYFLCELNHSILPHLLFPIGQYSKHEVRKIAKEFNLANADRRSSAGICFIGKRSFSDFLSEYLPPAPGAIRCVDTGRIIGTHEGVALWTIGQGARISGATHPWFICGKNVERKELYACQEIDDKPHPALHCSRFELRNMHWIGGSAPDVGQPFEFRFRHRQTLQHGTMSRNRAGLWSVQADTPQRAVTPGQVFVAYRGEECLGGGVISSLPRQATPEWRKAALQYAAEAQQ